MGFRPSFFSRGLATTQKAYLPISAEHCIRAAASRQDVPKSGLAYECYPAASRRHLRQPHSAARLQRQHPSPFRSQAFP
jgi:hypothetical protein